MTNVPHLSLKTAALVAMARADPGAMVDNLDTTLFALPSGAGDIPVTRNSGTLKTCYVCCPSVAYIDYPLSELRHFHGKLGLSLASTAMSGLLAMNPLPNLDPQSLGFLDVKFETRR